FRYRLGASGGQECDASSHLQYPYFIRSENLHARVPFCSTQTVSREPVAQGSLQRTQTARSSRQPLTNHRQGNAHEQEILLGTHPFLPACSQRRLQQQQEGLSAAWRAAGHTWSLIDTGAIWHGTGFRYGQCAATDNGQRCEQDLQAGRRHHWSLGKLRLGSSRSESGGF